MEQVVQIIGSMLVLAAFVATVRKADGAAEIECDDLISTMPLRHLVRALGPGVPPNVVKAAEGLRYRDFLTVALVVPQEYSFPDNWIYIHAAEARLGRCQNYGSWSPFLVKDGRTCLGLEYFVNEGDDNVDVIRAYLASEWPDIHPVGRNGMHRYNNQDHSMYTAMLTVENIVDGARHDVWSVNVEDEYHEEKGSGVSSAATGTGRSAPVMPSR